MIARRSLIRSAGTLALLGALTLGGVRAVAQEATPEAAAAALPPRPAHIHNGDCRNLGDIAAPLTDLTEAQGQRVGQANRAVLAESSYTSVPMTLDQILASDHAINVHESAENIDVYIACGEVGGALDANGALTIGLRELNGSGYTGIAFLAPGADGASTNVSVFIANANAGRAARQGAGGMTGTPEAMATMEGVTPTAEAGMAGMMGTPEAGGMTATMEAGTTTGMMGTPEAGAATGQPVTVGLSEFMIDMPDSVSAGSTTFNVTNNGTTGHSFEIEGNGVEQRLPGRLSPGESGTLTVDLTPGTYTVYCPVDDHRGMGMERQLTVS